MTKENIKICKEMSNKNIFAIVTDNENKMNSFRKKISNEYPEILTYSCNFHYLNILEQHISPQTVLKHVIQIQKYMRNHHITHGLLKKRADLHRKFPTKPDGIRN